MSDQHFVAKIDAWKWKHRQLYRAIKVFFLLIRSCNYPNSDRIITEMKEVLSNLFHKYLQEKKERKKEEGWNCLCC